MPRIPRCDALRPLAMSSSATSLLPNVAAVASGESGQLELVDLLLDAGADPRARDDGGLPPIHSAALFGNVEVVADLLDRGLNARGTFDSTLAHTAAPHR